jgi:uncharacterized protein
MKGNHFSLILLSTNQCNAACDYCFEDKSDSRLSVARLQIIIDKVLDHMDIDGIESLTVHWQGGEAMLLPPDWYAAVHEKIGQAAADRGKRVDHGLQTNLLNYGPKWNPIIGEMFGNSISTSLDFPNLHRRMPGRDPEHYSTLWTRKFHQARTAGIDVKLISVPNQSTLACGAERFYEHLVGELGVSDFQINTPFPGGEANAIKQGMPLDIEDLTRFHVELADIWLTRGYREGIRIGPFDTLLDYFSHHDACLPCIWGQNCADEFISIDARGNVGQCDCWVTSYPEYCFGNIFDDGRLTDLLRTSSARRQFLDRPLRLVQKDCIECDYLTLCHGGCPVRTYTVRGTLFEKDPYCLLYKTIFRHMEQAAARLSHSATRESSPGLRHDFL